MQAWADETFLLFFFKHGDICSVILADCLAEYDTSV